MKSDAITRLVLVAVATVPAIGLAGRVVAEDETAAQAEQHIGVEGTFVRVAENDEGWVVVGYRIANESVGEKYMLVRVGLTLTETTGPQTITRDDINSSRLESEEVHSDSEKANKGE